MARVSEQARTTWLSLPLPLPPAASLVLFAWLLTLHPPAAGRNHAAYEGMDIVVALLWLRLVDCIALTRWDPAGRRSHWLAWHRAAAFRENLGAVTSHVARCV
ncbi:hypothetical protein [Aromatoleum evansii]|uniref:hypothetical protein n=1 Tax=Aromatoleum evansii TaxID=59406 RepID=UPI0030D9C015